MIVPRESVATGLSDRAGWDLPGAVRTWSPPRGTADVPLVSIEPWPGGWRVRLTYLEVQSGVVFPETEPMDRDRVHERLDRLFEVLAWRVTRPPARREVS